MHIRGLRDGYFSRTEEETRNFEAVISLKVGIFSATFGAIFGKLLGEDFTIEQLQAEVRTSHISASSGDTHCLFL